MAFSPKRPVPEADYFLARATAEARLAERARGQRSATIHHQLASTYLDRLFGPAGPDRGERRDTRPEKRKALMSVFAHYSAILAPGAGDSDLCDLLRRLDGPA